MPGDPSPLGTTLLPARILLSATAIFGAIGPFGADWNETHIYNPRWPPHAKFHNGQTMSTGVGLGLLTAYFAWRRTHTETMSGAMDNLLIATLLSSLYWVTQLSAIWYPGTDWCDEEFRHLGTPQKKGAPVLLGAGWVAFGLGWWRGFGFGQHGKVL
jgi:hypothetical protein